MQLDPQAAATIGDADTKRIVRALEVIEATGRAFSDQRRIDEMPEVVYNSFYFVVARPRQVLYGAIEQRVDDMLQMGWLAEVQSLRERGCTRRDQAMQAIGYRHLLAHLEGDLDYQEAVRLIKRDTRRFAKRQLTWFRAESRRRLSGDRTGESAAFRWLEWATADEFQACVQQAVEAARRIYQP